MDSRQPERHEGDAVNVPHLFQKKSKKGIAAPREKIEKIKVRLKIAEELHPSRKG
jgi:phage-related protein